ncbi:MAG: YbbR-like domain-containing protein [Lachnospira sp.]
MREKIFNNFGLKVLSAVLAVVLWTIIVNIYDPTTSVTFSNVTVQLINQESLTDKNYTYEVVDGSKISVYVSGPKSKVTNLKTSDIVATADLSKITAYADYVDIDVSIVKDGQTMSDIIVTPKTTALKLNIENRATKEFEVALETTGNVPNGYTVVDKITNPATIKVTCASSAMDRVAQIKAFADISGATGDFTGDSDVKLYDADGNEIVDDAYELSRIAVEYTVKVSKVKSVGIISDISGDVKKGYVCTKVSRNMESVVIAGESDVLDSISDIIIPSEKLSIADHEKSTTFNINLADYLPNDVKIISDGSFTLEVTIEPTVTIDLTLDTNNIQEKGLSNDLIVDYGDINTISVKIEGSQAAIDAVKPEDIKMTIDLSGKNVGTYTVKIDFDIPDNCMISNGYMITVTLESPDEIKEPNVDEI